MYNGFSHGTRASEASKLHEDVRSNAAVADTAGRCVTYGGDVVATYFCASSGGYTANKADIWGGSDVPYLRGVPDPYESSSYDPWSSNVSLDGLQFAAKLAGYITGEPSGAGHSVYVTSILIHRAWPSGFVRTVDVTWSNGTKSTGVTGAIVRIALGLHSNKFFIAGSGGRLFGADRYLEAVAASKRAYPAAGSAASAIVVNGDDVHYADMACAVALSRVAKAPVLLVHQDELPSSVSTEIRRLHPARLYIIGDSHVVSSSIATKLKTLVSSTERLGGSDRFKTSAVVARKAVALGATTSKAVVCSGRVWTDAAVAAEIAGGSKRPLLLTEKGSLSAAAASALGDLKVKKTTVIGGSDALSAATVKSVCAITGESAPAKRIGTTGGAFDTAAAAAAWSVSSLGFSPSTVYVAAGDAIPDVFIAAGLSAAVKHPVVLTDSYTPSSATYAYIYASRAAIKDVTIVGRQTEVGIACALSLQSAGH